MTDKLKELAESFAAQRNYANDEQFDCLQQLGKAYLLKSRQLDIAVHYLGMMKDTPLASLVLDKIRIAERVEAMERGE